MITENLSTLKIHKLTKKQYDRELAAGNIDESALYLTPDDDVMGTLSGEIITANDVSPVEHSLKVNVESKNLIPYPYSETTETVNGVLFTDNGDGTITATGTTTAGSSYFRVRSRSDQLKLKAGKYFFKALTTTGSISTLYAYIDLTTISNGTKEYIDYGNGVAFTLEEDAEAYITVMVMPQHDGSPVIYKPMVIKGTTATDWTPYVDVSGVEVSRCGKNFASVNVVDKFNGYTTVWEGKMTGNFVLSWKHDLTVTHTSSGLFRWHFEDGTNGVSNAISKNILFSKISGTITKVEVLNWCEPKSGSVYDIQLEFGTTQTDFESSVKTQTVTANADGTVNGLTSVSPNMTLLSNTESVIINCEYLNEYYSESEDRYNNFIMDQKAATKTYVDNFGGKLGKVLYESSDMFTTPTTITGLSDYTLVMVIDSTSPSSTGEPILCAIDKNENGAFTMSGFVAWADGTIGCVTLTGSNDTVNGSGSTANINKIIGIL